MTTPASGCPFCAIAAGAAPASIVWQDDTAIAFMDLRQAVPGHVLIAPRLHAETLWVLDEDIAAHLMRLAVRIARAAHGVFAGDGLSLWQSNGAAAGQEVPHAHLHVQPRRVGDGLLRIYCNGAPANSSPAALATLAAQLRERLR